jgi:hypothetical protein
MSTDGNKVVEQVRRMFGDPDTGRQNISTDMIQQAVVRWVAFCAAEVGLGALWMTPAISLVPGKIDYPLNRTIGTDTEVEFQTLVDLRYHRDFLPIPRRAYAEVQALRAVVVTQGRPVMCCVMPDPAQNLVVMMSSNPQIAEDLDALVTVVPETWNPTDAAPPSIPFSSKACRGLELLVAAAVGKTLGPETLTALALNEGTFDEWYSEALGKEYPRQLGGLLGQARLEVIRLKRANGPLSFAWVTAWSRYGG